jgi:hypothetical protein
VEHATDLRLGLVYGSLDRRSSDAALPRVEIAHPLPVILELGMQQRQHRDVPLAGPRLQLFLRPVLVETAAHSDLKPVAVDVLPKQRAGLVGSQACEGDQVDHHPQTGPSDLGLPCGAEGELVDQLRDHLVFRHHDLWPPTLWELQLDFA